MPRHRPANRLSECTSQCLTIRVEMLVLMPKLARESPQRATTKAEQENRSVPD
jgi:hypothetical protein